MPTAPELKQQGNAFFKSGSLVEAARYFTQAEVANSTDAVYPSNLSAALYELGDYAASVDAIIRAWRLLSLNDAQASGPLMQRLSARLAKALCHGARCGSITQAMVDAPVTQRAVAELSRKSVDNSAWHEWNAVVDDFGGHDWNEVGRQAKIILSRLPIFWRAAHSWREYHTIGHDNPMSLLDDWGPQSTHKSPIDLSKFKKNELGEISLLLGGAGDARHAYSSLVGAERAYLRLPCDKQDSLQLHITLLDIHPAPLARDLCVMLLLDQLMNTGKDDATEKAEIMATIFYTYVAVVVPSYCEKRLLSTMEDLIARLIGGPPRLPSWIHVNAEAIDPIINILRFWVDLPSQGKFRASDLLADQKVKTANDLEEAANSANMLSEHRDIIRNNLNMARKEVSDALKRATPEQLAPIGLRPLPYSASAEAKREYEEQRKHVIDTMASHNIHGTGDMDMENIWYRITKVFMPPGALWSRHPGLDSFQGINFGTRNNSDEFFQPRPQIKSHIAGTWKPNWTLFDKASETRPHLKELNAFSTPISIREFNTRFNIKTAAAGDEALAFDHVSDFFRAAARALATLAGRVTLEFICGDLMQELSKMKFNEDLSRPREFPRSFTRVYLSNIPDYTHGIINTVVFILPVVKCKEESLVSASSLIRYVWKDDAEFIYTFTLLLPDDVERFLGCRFTGRSVIHDLTILGRSLRPPALTNLASRPELEAWLIRTLIYTLSPDVGGGLELDARLPNNVVAFFSLLVYLYNVGYPAHWLGELVQRIVSSEVITGVTAYRGRWPIPTSDARRIGPTRRIRLDPWTPDFENTLTAAGRGLPFYVRLPPDYEVRPEGICALEAFTTPCASVTTAPASWPGHIVGLLFYRPRPGTGSAREIVGDIASILEGSRGSPPGEMHILTAVDMVELPRIRWRLGRRRLEMMRKAGWSMVAYRTDLGEPFTSPVPARMWREV